MYFVKIMRQEQKALQGSWPWEQEASVSPAFSGSRCGDLHGSPLSWCVVKRPQWEKNGSSERLFWEPFTGLLKLRSPWVPQRAELVITAMRSPFSPLPGTQEVLATCVLSPLWGQPSCLTEHSSWSWWGGISHAALRPPWHLAFLPVSCHLWALMSQR